MVDKPLRARYLYSFQWALARSQPTSMSLNMTLDTTEEKVLSIVATFSCLSAASMFLSTVTAAMTEQKRAAQAGRERITAVSVFSKEYNISPKLTLRMKKFAEMEARDSGARREALLSQMLPRKLIVDLRFEAHAPVLRAHDFFEKLASNHERTLAEICSAALSDLTPFAEDIIFVKGDPCSQMYFIISGEFIYTLGGSLRDVGVQNCLGSSQRYPALKPAIVGAGRWLCEAALWTTWENCGELIAGNGCGKILTVRVEGLMSTLRSHELAKAQAVFYARQFVQELNEDPVGNRTDLRYDANFDLTASQRSSFCSSD